MKKLFLLFLSIFCLQTFASNNPVDSLSKPTLPKTYDFEKLIDYVCYDIPDSLNGDYLMEVLNRIDQKVDNIDFCERLKTDIVCDYAKNSISADPKPYFDEVLKAITADSLRQKLNDAYADSKKTFGNLWPGQPATDLTFKDKVGKTHSLKELKGKLLFIDIWGTWCVPCLEEIPYLNKLQAKYKDNKKVLIMSIACDKQKDREKWLRFLDKHKDMTWAQYHVTDESNKVLDNVYRVIGIPRFIIIAPDGTIVDSDAQRPSFDTFNDYFDSIVKKYAL